MMLNRQEKRPCLKRNSNPRSQGPSDEGLRLRPPASLWSPSNGYRERVKIAEREADNCLPLNGTIRIRGGLRLVYTIG
jgi:hypothetical protein